MATAFLCFYHTTGCLSETTVIFKGKIFIDRLRSIYDTEFGPDSYFSVALTKDTPQLKRPNEKGVKYQRMLKLELIFPLGHFIA